MKSNTSKFVVVLIWCLTSSIASIAQPYCDQAQGSAGFPSSLPCQTAICNLDAFCCENTWDSFCASAALTTPACSDCLSGEPVFCNSVFLNGGFPSDQPCQTAVCAIDNFCCTDVWDASCASLAQITSECTGCLSPVENDNCISAIGLTIAPSCSPVQGSLNDATRSGYDPICDPFAVPNDDVFYVFIAPANGQLTVNVQPAGNDPLLVEVLQPSNLNNICQGFWQVACIYGNNNGQLMTTNVTGLSVGSSYYIRIYTESANPAADGDFTVCLIGEAPPCFISIDPSAIPESEDCGPTLNNGCEMTVPNYETMACNGSVTGQCWSDGSGRDSDWYQFSITTNNTPVSFTAKAEFPFVLELVNIADCNAPVVVASMLGGPCQSITLAEELAGGQYAVVIRPQAAASVSCQSNSRFYEISSSLPVQAQHINPSDSDGMESRCIDPTLGTSGSPISMTVEPGGEHYQWFYDFGPTFGNVQTVSLDQNGGDFYVDVTDANGCVTRSDTFLVIFHNPLEPNLSDVVDICGETPGSVTISADPPYPTEANVSVSGTITTYTITGSPIVIPVTEAGIVQVASFTDGHGCSAGLGASVTVQEFQSINAAFSHAGSSGNSHSFSSSETQAVIHTWTLTNTVTNQTLSSAAANPTFNVDLGNDDWTICHLITLVASECTSYLCLPFNASIANSIGELVPMSFSIFPNPNNGSFVVRSPEFETIRTVCLSDITGRSLLCENWGSESNHRFDKVIPSGSYFVTLSTFEGAVATQLVLIQN